MPEERLSGLRLFVIVFLTQCFQSTQQLVELPQAPGSTMCCICAIFGADIQDAGTFFSGFLATKHRGPHASRVECIEKNNTSSILGYHRLEVGESLNRRAIQPLRRKSILLICDGDIYDWKEMGPDVRVMMRLYKECKYDFKRFGSLLEGVFAFCLVDLARRRILIGRDFLGVRPLFKMTGDDGFLAISSCAKGLKPLQIANPNSGRNYTEFKAGTIEVYSLRTDGGASFNESVTFEPKIKVETNGKYISALRDPRKQLQLIIETMADVAPGKLGLVLGEKTSLTILNLIMKKWSPTKCKLQIFKLVKHSELDANLAEFGDRIHIHQINKDCSEIVSGSKYSDLIAAARYASRATDVVVLISDLMFMDVGMFNFINQATCEYGVEIRTPLANFKFLRACLPDDHPLCGIKIENLIVPDFKNMQIK